jgi:hypothetical protein
MPDLSSPSVVVRHKPGGEDPLWWSSSAVVDGRFVAKFAWSGQAARRVAHEIGVLTALSSGTDVPFLPEIVASSLDPVMLVTRRVAGATLFEVVNTIDRDRAARQLAAFLAALHHPATSGHVQAAVGRLPHAEPPASPELLRARFGRWVRPDQQRTVMRWCDWADATLADLHPTVLVHADLHGDNQVWEHDQLRLVVDFETASVAEAEYDLRALPGTGPGVELLTATMPVAPRDLHRAQAATQSVRVRGAALDGRIVRADDALDATDDADRRHPARTDVVLGAVRRERRQFEQGCVRVDEQFDALTGEQATPGAVAGDGPLAAAGPCLGL